MAIWKEQKSLVKSNRTSELSMSSTVVEAKVRQHNHVGKNAKKKKTGLSMNPSRPPLVNGSTSCQTIIGSIPVLLEARMLDCDLWSSSDRDDDISSWTETDDDTWLQGGRHLKKTGSTLEWCFVCNKDSELIIIQPTLSKMDCQAISYKQL